MGCQLLPASVVFHRPPEATATYHTLRSRGSTAMSPTRPGASAGPRLRSGRPRTASAGRTAGGPGGPAGARPPRNAPGARARTTDAATRSRFMVGNPAAVVRHGGRGPAGRARAPFPGGLLLVAEQQRRQQVQVVLPHAVVVAAGVQVP